jgi:hypothetical protein
LATRALVEKLGDRVKDAATARPFGGTLTRDYVKAGKSITFSEGGPVLYDFWWHSSGNVSTGVNAARKNEIGALAPPPPHLLGFVIWFGIWRPALSNPFQRVGWSWSLTPKP